MYCGCTTSAHRASRIRLDANRCHKLGDLATFSHRFFDLFRKRGHVRDAPAIDAFNACRAQTTRRTRAVHRNVAATNDDHALVRKIRGKTIASSTQEPYRREHVFGVLARAAELVLVVRTHRKIDRVEIVREILIREVGADRGIGECLHAC